VIGNGELSAAQQLRQLGDIHSNAPSNAFGNAKSNL
jgi:hypothetical protein